MSKKVLIVEDNEPNMKLFNDLLEVHGYSTLQAQDGFPVLALAREHRPDLILMDVQLPGMDGLEATGLLKSDPASAGIPVFALTAMAMRGDEERIRAAGCDGYIVKPIDYKALLDQVKQALA